MGILWGLMKALLLTLAAEYLVLLLLRCGKSWRRSSLLCNVLTNPLLNCILLLMTALFGFGSWRYGVMVLLEAAVFFGEGALYRLLMNEPWRKCLKYSALCNGVSLLVGLLI